LHCGKHNGTTTTNKTQKNIKYNSREERTVDEIQKRGQRGKR
jgi:hypothetical protein